MLPFWPHIFGSSGHCVFKVCVHNGSWGRPRPKYSGARAIALQRLREMTLFDMQVRNRRHV
eukprot:6925437-Lingulodinium_polyedra.AAC.1